LDILLASYGRSRGPFEPKPVCPMRHEYDTMPLLKRLSLQCRTFSSYRFSPLRVFLNVRSLGDVDTVQKLSDILVTDTADLLDISGGLGDVLERDTSELNLILLVLAWLDIDTWVHGDPAHNLLANEVSDLDLEQTSLLVLLDVDVDWEMGIDIAHLVLEALGDADDQVVDDGADGSL